MVEYMNLHQGTTERLADLKEWLLDVWNEESWGKLMEINKEKWFMQDNERDDLELLLSNS